MKEGGGGVGKRMKDGGGADEGMKTRMTTDSDCGTKGKATRRISNTLTTEKTLIHITSLKRSRGMTTQYL